MKRILSAALVALVMVATITATVLADPKPPGGDGSGNEGRESAPIGVVAE